MTDVCGGGPSSPLPLTEPLINLTAAGAASLAAAYGFPELEPVIALAAASIDLVLVNYCSTDPPADPGLTAADVANAIDVMNPGLAIPAIAKVQQWFLSRYWYDVCHCTAGPTPAPPALSNPNTGIGTNTGAGSGLNAPPCWTVTAPMTLTDTVNFGHSIVAPFLPSGPGSTISIAGGLFPLSSIMPPGTNACSWAFTSLGSTHDTLVRFQTIDTSGVIGKTLSLARSTISGTQSGTSAINPSIDGPYAQIAFLTDPTPSPLGTTSWQGTFSFTCSGAPPSALVQPCCPPDPLIDAKLDLIYGLVLNLYNRNPGSSAYRLGTVHSSLRGSGTIPVHELVGVLVHISSTPGGVVLPGQPPYLFDQGWLSCATPDGFIDEKRLTRLNQIWMPSLFPLADTFGYVLFDGVVADITELLRA